MKRKDLWWILAYPIYQLVGTFRHEASHALVAWLQGARITEFVFWPTQGYWGYVNWEGAVTISVSAAPYLCDLLTFLLFFPICLLCGFGKKRWVWLNMIALGIISPLVNSAHNYRVGFSSLNDVGKLLEAISPALVHGYFILTLVAYFTGLVLVFTTSRMART